MSDEDLLSHCLSALTGEYGEIATTLLVESLRKRLNRPSRVAEALYELADAGVLSPAEYRRLANAPWQNKSSNQ